MILIYLLLLEKEPGLIHLIQFQILCSVIVSHIPIKFFWSNMSSVVVPKLVQEALITPEWKNAVMEEIKALEKNGTWDLVKLLEGKSHVWCKWAFSVKHKPDGIVDLFKARLMAKRYT